MNFFFFKKNQLLLEIQCKIRYTKKALNFNPIITIDDRNGGNHFSKAPTNSFPFTGPVNVVGWTKLMI
jgi:hypothetical protein